MSINRYDPFGWDGDRKRTMGEALRAQRLAARQAEDKAEAELMEGIRRAFDADRRSMLIALRKDLAEE